GALADGARYRRADTRRDRCLRGRGNDRRPPRASSSAHLSQRKIQRAAGTMIAGLVLAAGESTRMGQDKALLLYRGRTFLETIVSTLNEGGIERVAVVLGHHAQEIRRAVV